MGGLLAPAAADHADPIEETHGVGGFGDLPHGPPIAEAVAGILDEADRDSLIRRPQRSGFASSTARVVADLLSMGRQMGPIGQCPALRQFAAQKLLQALPS
jgi:hypothetical protein